MASSAAVPVPTGHVAGENDHVPTNLPAGHPDGRLPPKLKPEAAAGALAGVT